MMAATVASAVWVASIGAAVGLATALIAAPEGRDGRGRVRWLLLRLAALLAADSGDGAQ